ncbi:hypothetical protein BDN71DRAFT_147120 [Pleurotus eryngii]|uniref:HIT-type domain-containing protein n=1 Tax=Pleurotus eryngii TaxID=5323 RepID=A0A9P5ZR03_PLEER|nr:hypothetical protein BDN71DRAFT_147120 [Pleurotus eryngii]
MVKKTREHHARKAAALPGLDPEIIAKRKKRHLDELERSNYSEPTLLNTDADGETDGTTKGRARQTISDKRDFERPGKRKKSTMNIRTAVLYRKNLSTLIEESHIAEYPSSVPTYLTAVSPPPRYPPRLLCSICGYWGQYKCKRCDMPFCDRSCEGVHNETRCERRVM